MGKLSVSQRLAHGLGKIRRVYYWTVRKEYILRSHARRRGECVRCGACCKLMFRCPWLDESGALPVCVRHETRPMNCRVYPIDEADLADRDVIMPDKKCGYSFIQSGEVRRSSANGNANSRNQASRRGAEGL
jgi:hypothetical protein